MEKINATEVRKNWSETCDNVIRTKPSFIKRTRDSLLLSSYEDALRMLAPVKFDVVVYSEKEGVTLCMEKIDIAEHGKTLEDAKEKLAEALLEYSDEYYDNYQLYRNAPNRQGHLPYVIKALLLANKQSVMEEMECRDDYTNVD